MNTLTEYKSGLTGEIVRYSYRNTKSGLYVSHYRRGELNKYIKDDEYKTVVKELKVEKKK